LASGTAELAKGTDQLADGMPQLADGIAQVADGASQLADGTAELADGLDEAADGASELAAGARELADGLAEGKDQLPTYSATDRENLSDVVATPVSTTNLLGTAGFGAGWVTLLMVLALWAGALATFLVFKPVSGQLLGSSRSSLRLVAQSLVPSILVVATQAVLVTAIGQFALGLSFEKVLAVGGLMLVAAVAFVVVTHALAAWFGNAGRLVALGLAILSLASALTSAAPAVFGVLRGFSPLTPALDAVRAVVTESSGVATNTFLLAGWLIAGLAASAIAIVRNRTTSFTALLQAHGVVS
jgi:putative membrane protein